ncbi:MAG: hypothetical protein U0Q16_16520 [Bryobacteraceae bacterium]
MEWTRSEHLALANHNCTFCHGVGMMVGRRGKESTCNCVLRSIFRSCYERFRTCIEKEKSMSQARLEASLGGSRRNSWGRKDEEYIADFYLVSKRSLTPGDLRIFRYHFLLGADWRLCARRLEMDRGQFFHAVYRIEQHLGRVFRDLMPYPLYPLDEYFHGTTSEEMLSRARRERLIQMGQKQARPVRPPVRLAA